MMKNYRFFICTFLFATIFSYNSSAQSIIDADNSAIIYSGRIDFTNPKAPEFGYSGVRIRTKFEGTSLKVKITSPEMTNYFYIFIDSVLQPKFMTTTTTTELNVASGLKDTIHSLEMIKITESGQGKCIFKGLVLDASKNIIAGTVSENRKIHFIGNSITCGYGIEVLNNALHFDPATENFYDGYAAITARSLQADYNIVSRSGIGIYRNYGDPKTGSTNNMYTIYDRTFYDKITPKWNFFQFQPDVVCVNLGTNDFSTNQGDNTLFTNQYNKFVDTLRLKYPNAKIVLLMGPMLSNTATVKSLLQSVVKTHVDAGDNNVSMFEMSAQGALGYGADWHPSRAQARKNAGELISYLKGITGWNTAPILQLANTSNGGTSIDISFNDTVTITAKTITDIKLYADSISQTIDSIQLLPGQVKSLRIYLKNRLKQSQKLWLNYHGTSIENNQNIKLQAFDNLIVTNTVVDIKITTATIDKNAISININRAVANVNCNYFSIKSSTQTSLLIDSIKINTNQITFYTASSIVANDSIYLSYNGNCIVAADNVPMYPFTNFKIKSLSTFSHQNNSASNLIRFYPNPMGNKNLTIKIDANVSSCLELSIFTSDGKACFYDTICTNNYTVPNAIFNGATKSYFVTITGNIDGKTIRESTTILR
jgi:lysophospholipase L1-like esterase